jgi:hypothetical protein
MGTTTAKTTAANDPNIPSLKQSLPWLSSLITRNKISATNPVVTVQTNIVVK